MAKAIAATLVIAKLERLLRNAAFLLTQRDSGVLLDRLGLREENGAGRSVIRA